MIEVRTLGAAEIVVGRKRLTPKTEGLFALAVYLCVRAGEASSRDALCEMFWPGADPAKARHNLRQMLYRLRNAGIATEEEGDLCWVSAALVRNDYSRVLSESWVAEAAASEVITAQHFLPHFTPRLSPQYEQWLERTRSSIASQFRRATLAYLTSARSEGRWTAVEQWADMLLSSDPLNEEGTLAKAESIAMTGSKARAIELLDGYVAELGNHSHRIALPATTLRRRIAALSTSFRSPARAEVALVGRSDSMRTLTTLIDSSVGGSGGAVLLHGAPGIGKTRLCIEARDYASLRGATALSVRADDSRAERPLGLATRLAHLLHGQEGAAATPPAAMGVVRRMIATSPTEHSLELAGSATVSLDQFAWALLEMARVASIERPLLLLLDDLHNADRSSLQVLLPLLQPHPESRLAVLATTRSTWLTQHDDNQPGTLRAARLHVPPLSATDAAEFVAAIGQVLADSLSLDEQRQLCGIAGGNPLFLREMTAHGRRGVSHPHSTLTLSRVIEQRCALLSQSELRILRFVSLLGPLASLPLLCSLLSKTNPSPAQDVESLERDGLLALGDDGVLHIHECWRAAIDTNTPRATRAALAFECASGANAHLSQKSAPVHEWHTGYLFELAGSARDAMDCYRRSGVRLVAMGVPALAIEAFTKALSHATSSEDLAHLHVLLASALHSSDQPAAAAKACREATRHISSRLTSAKALRAEAVAVLAEAEWKQGRLGGDFLPQLLEFAKDKSIPALQRHLCANAGLRIACNVERTLAHAFFDSVRRADPAPEGEWIALWTHLVYRAEFGTEDEVRNVIARLQQGDDDAIAAQTRTVILRHAAIALRMFGDLSAAVVLGEEAISLALNCGLPSGASAAAIVMAFGHLDHGLLEQASTWIDCAQNWQGGSPVDERSRSMRHVVGRLYLQQNRYEDALRLHVPALESIETDSMSVRRANDAACAAVAAIRCNEEELALRCLAIAQRALAEARPSWSTDFAANANILCLIARNDAAGAASFRTEYLQRRGNELRHPVARVFTHLSSAGACPTESTRALTGA